jgi:hypothetical protein
VKGARIRRDDKLLEELLKDLFINANQNRVQKENLHKALLKTYGVGALVLGATVTLGALDYHYGKTEITSNLIDKVSQLYRYLIETDPITEKMRLYDILPVWMLSLTIIGSTLWGWYKWGVNSMTSLKYTTNNRLVEAVLKKVHYSVDSESHTYSAITGKKENKWRVSFYNHCSFLEGLSKLSRDLLQVYDKNILTNAIYTVEITHDTYVRPHPLEIITEVNTVHGRKPVTIPKYGKSVTFGLRKQPNQEPMIAEFHYYENQPKVEPFVGPGAVVQSLSTGQLVVGSIGPEKPKNYPMSFRKYTRNARLINLIQEETLKNLYGDI